jgi:hypothetical protein
MKRNACGIYGTVAGSVDWVRFACSAPVRVRISSAPPRCSPDAHPLGFFLRGVSGEQRGGAAEILSRTGVEHGERTQSLDPAAARTLYTY